MTNKRGYDGDGTVLFLFSLGWIGNRVARGNGRRIEIRKAEDLGYL